MIHGKIARILSQEEVVLNIGEDDKVKLGMEFVIYSEGDHVTDPETHEDLGAIEHVKGRVIVSHVMEKMSRAKTKYLPLEASLSPLVTQMDVMLGRTERVRLKVASDEVNPLASVDDKVRVGDSVRSVNQPSGG